MPSTSLNLHIPEPCHEDWQQMIPEAKGRHCLACQKTVIDFTRLSDKEIIDFFANKPTSVCGRFRPEQLNPRMAENPQPVSRWKLYALAFTATMTMKTIFTETSKAQAPTEQREAEINRHVFQGEMGLVAHTAPSGEKFALSGLVADSISREALGGVTVYIKGTQTGTITDAQGKFMLSVKMGDVLVFNFIGYEIKDVVVASVRPLSVELSSTAVVLGDVWSYEKPPFHKRIFYRIKSWFR